MNRLEKTCLTGLMALPVGISAIALGFLSTPPSISCDDVDAQAAVSVRLQCAQRRAERQTPESLTAAIEVLENVPTDDPYHQQSDRLVQTWKAALLAQAETEVQAGNLDKAISIMRPLPQDAKVRSWKSLWQKGQGLMKTSLAQMEKREWQQAFQTASQLRQIENEYWATEQYNSLVQQIQSDREFRDYTLRNPVEPEKTRKDIEFSSPQPAKLARSSRPLWKDDAPISHPVSAIERPKPEIQHPEIQPEPAPQIQPSPELEPEPPVETLQSSEQKEPKIEIPVPEKHDRT